MKKVSRQQRIKAYFLLCVIVGQLSFPTVTFALSDNPIQPEFASFEEFGSSDMVNLLTGDLNYNIPLLQIPSPEGGFNLPLSYHAGIEVDEESSWVGLGWSLNPGVMDRFVSVYPDDFDGTQSINSNFSSTQSLGNSYIENYVFYKKIYDSNNGQTGVVSFMNIIDFSRSNASGVGATVLGLNMSNKGVSYDLYKSAMGLTDLGTLFIPSGEAAKLFVAGTTAMSAADAVVAYASGQTKSANESYGGVTVQSNIERNGFLGIGSKVAYKYWLGTKAKSVRPLGTLFLGNTNNYNPNTNGTYGNGELIFNNGYGGNTTSQQPHYMSFETSVHPRYAHDAYVYYEPNVALSYQFNPFSIAKDNFNIKANGLSGSISPMRMDVGSISDPAETDDTHYYFFVTPYLGSMVGGYKVPFLYNGEVSNSYQYDLTTNSSGQIKTNFETDWNFSSNSNLFQINLTDPKIYSQDVPNFLLNQKKEGNRPDASLYNSKLVHGRHIEWYTNDEIINSPTIKNYFMDCGINRSTFPLNGIGGFAITNEGGMTYHFTVPVYNKQEVKRVEKGSSKYTVENNNKYATMWLLTGITGPDFVDRGTVGAIDDEDWGYWVKLDYGMYNNNYMWRSPYFEWQVSKDMVYQFKRGVKETYYLNTIKTRSHTAFFAKSVKKDGKSFYETDGNDRGDVISGYSQNPSLSLKLDDIYIVPNEVYTKLITPVSQGGYGIFTASYNNPQNWQNGTPNNIDNNMLLSSTISSTVKNYLNQNQYQHFHFNYNYNLCKGTFNSFDLINGFAPAYSADPAQVAMPTTASRDGRLTLESIESRGMNDQKIVPDYEFNYGNINDVSVNPTYSPYKYDDYGLYKPDNSWGYDNTPHNSGPDGAQWSLRKIMTPLGGTIAIEYERDTYSSVNGLDCISSAPQPIPTQNYASSFASNRVYLQTAFGDVSKQVSVGDNGVIKLPGYATVNPYSFKQPQSFNFKVTAVNASGGYFDYMVLSPMISGNFSDIASNPFLNGPTISLFKDEKFGGNLRVKSISSVDELGNNYTNSYDYSIVRNGKQMSSGVASFETTWNKVNEFDFYNYYDHPYLPIMYAQVTVKNGRYSNPSANNSFETNTSTQFKFYTPHQSMLTVDKGTHITNVNSTTSGGGAYYCVYNNGNTVTYAHDPWQTPVNQIFRARSGHIITYDKTSLIGNLKEVTTYNSRSEAIQKTEYTYSNNTNANIQNGMGIYGETNFMFEYFLDPVIGSPQTNRHMTYRLIQSSKVHYPTILTEVNTNIQGVTTKNTILERDYKTGKTTKALTTLGSNAMETYYTVSTPAYYKYPELGSKCLDPSNKNMMAATTQEKQYSVVGSGYPSSSNTKLLSSVVTTFGKTSSANFRYRLYDNASGTYMNKTFTTANSNEIEPIRPYQQYIWKSPVDKDGTIKASDYQEFNWASGATQAGNWVKTSEATLYDKYSNLLEYTDVNSRKISSKYAHQQTYAVSTLENCGYGEWCFSSAEDESKDNAAYMGGEVIKGISRFKSNALSHTGNYALKCPDNSYGFAFRGLYSTDFKPGKTYRASVWVHKTNYLDANLYISIRNGTTPSAGIIYYQNTGLTSSSFQNYGDWYKFDLDITIPAANTLTGTPGLVEFGCWNPTGGSQPSAHVIFDDFRVHPVSNAFDANVYDDHTGLLMATLDKENIATKFYYDNAYRVIRVEKETKSGFKKVSETAYGFKKQ